MAQKPSEARVRAAAPQLDGGFRAASGLLREGRGRAGYDAGTGDAVREGRVRSYMGTPRIAVFCLLGGLGGMPVPVRR